MSTRIGFGVDSHRLEAARRLVIGGVEIEHDYGLIGHSDADVLIHAVIDAVLGAAGLGDIGQHFPDTDERYRDADSFVLLAATGEIVYSAGFGFVNIDSTVCCEQPKLAPHRDAMRLRIATALAIDADAVNVKFTTGEEIGFVGRGEGIAAFAIALLS